MISIILHATTDRRIAVLASDPAYGFVEPAGRKVDQARGAVG